MTDALKDREIPIEILSLRWMDVQRLTEAAGIRYLEKSIAAFTAARMTVREVVEAQNEDLLGIRGVSMVGLEVFDTVIGVAAEAVKILDN